MNPELLSEFLQLSSSQKLFFFTLAKIPWTLLYKNAVCLNFFFPINFSFHEVFGSFIQRRRNLSLDETDLNIELKAFIWSPLGKVCDFGIVLYLFVYVLYYKWSFKIHLSPRPRFAWKNAPSPWVAVWNDTTKTRADFNVEHILVIY